MSQFYLLNKKVFDILPGKSKQHFFVVEKKSDCNHKNTIWLHGIEKFFNETECLWDTVVLSIEFWHYPEIEKMIAEHPRLYNANVFLLTVGYKQYQFGHKCWKINFPWSAAVLLAKNKFTDVKEKPHGLHYGFSCLNNKPYHHRLLLGYNLYKRNLLDKIIFTQNVWDDNIPYPTMFETMPNFEDYKKLLPLATVPAEDNFKGDMYGTSHIAFTNAYCNITLGPEVEKVPYEQNINVEAMCGHTFKPFVSKQIPIWFSGRGHLAYLKYFGFETMDDLLPKDYDQMRPWQKVTAIIDIIIRGKEYIEDFYFDHLPEIQHNYDLAVSGTLEDKIIADIQKLIRG